MGGKRLRVWDNVRNVMAVRNLPPFCGIEVDYQDGRRFVCPNLDELREAIVDEELPVVSDLCDIPQGYCGFAVVNNGFDGTALYRVFKNGNCRSIWHTV